MTSPSAPTGGALDDALVLGPRWQDGAKVTLAPIEAALRCAEDGCRAVVRITVTKGDDRRATGALWIGGARDVAISIDGARQDDVVPPPELASTYAPRFRGPPPPGDPRESRIDAPRAFAIEGARGTTHVVVLEASVPVREIRRSIPERVVDASALASRHLLVSPGPRARGASLFVVSPAAAIERASTRAGLAYAGAIAASAPSDWRFEIRGDRACPVAVTPFGRCAAPDTAREEQGGVATETTWAAPLGSDLVLGAGAYDETPALVTNGGPLVGAGWAFGHDAGFRARFGWEVGLGSGGVLASIAADSDLSRRLVVAPVVSVASRGALLRPSVSAGVGAPVMIAPDVRAGGRVQLDAHLSAFGIVAWLDLLAPAPITASASVLGEVSF